MTTPFARWNQRLPRHARGFTLIEMIVAMTVGLVVSLVLMSVLSMFEGRKRTAGSVSDVNSAGVYAASTLDHYIRSAGDGFAQAAANAYGCQLNYRSTTPPVTLPLTGALTDPVFAAAYGTVSGTMANVVMAPVIILQGNTPAALLDGNVVAGGTGSSDVLMVMGGAGGGATAASSVYTAFNGVPTVSSLTLQNTVPFNAGDLVLVMDTAGSSGPAPCVLRQVSSVASTTTLSFAGSAPSLASFSVDGAAVALGNTTNSSFPSIVLIGAANGTSGGNNYNGLYLYDLLQLNATNGANTTGSVPIADSVLEIHALYGLATAAGSETVNCWQAPSGPNFDSQVLTSGTAAAAASLEQIKAIRVSMILKSPLLEKATGSDVQTTGGGQNIVYSNGYTAPTTITLFQDLANATAATACPVAAYPRTLTAAEQQYRYRTVEMTIPLRNALLN
jgi:type IV pilus assembly protein PilW